MSVPVRAKTLKLGSSWRHLGSSCLVLGKIVKSCWRSESFWRLILEPQRIAKVELWFERELNFRKIRGHFFSLFFCEKIKKTWKFSSRSNDSSTFADPSHQKKRSTDLHWVSSFCEFRLTRIEYGGVRAARDAAHSTSSAYSDGDRPQKKSMGKSKKCALTVMHVRVTTWSLTSREKKCFFLVFLEKSHLFTPSNSNANRFSWKNDKKVLQFIDL